MVRCAGCEVPILDRFLLKVLDRPWHIKCVQCCECQCTLTEKCFSREGRLYCKKDFFRRFGPKCGGCSEAISPSELVRRARSHVFHVSCLTCVLCNKQLSTGEELYVLDELRFVCKEDYLNSKDKDTTLLSVTTCSNPSLSPDRDTQDYSKDCETGPLSDKEVCNNENEEQTAGGKRRGPRTTIKAKQLETLKAAFVAAPKPTRHIREQLAQETGLSMRVIQVWFQNRRSKERRMKQQSTFGARRHVFFRNQRRIRTLQDRLDPGELINNGPFSYYGEYESEYYGPEGNYEYFHGPPSSQAQTPSDLGFIPTDPPSGGRDLHCHPDHPMSGDGQCFSDVLSHRALDSPSPELSGPGSIHSVSSDTCVSSTHYTTLGSGYINQLNHQSSEISQGIIW